MNEKLKEKDVIMNNIKILELKIEFEVGARFYTMVGDKFYFTFHHTAPNRQEYTFVLIQEKYDRQELLQVFLQKVKEIDKGDVDDDTVDSE